MDSFSVSDMPPVPRTHRLTCLELHTPCHSILNGETGTGTLCTHRHGQGQLAFSSWMTLPNCRLLSPHSLTFLLFCNMLLEQHHSNSLQAVAWQAKQKEPVPPKLSLPSASVPHSLPATCLSSIYLFFAFINPPNLSPLSLSLPSLYSRGMPSPHPYLLPHFYTALGMPVPVNPHNLPAFHDASSKLHFPCLAICCWEGTTQTHHH